MHIMCQVWPKGSRAKFLIAGKLGISLVGFFGDYPTWPRRQIGEAMLVMISVQFLTYLFHWWYWASLELLQPGTRQYRVSKLIINLKCIRDWFRRNALLLYNNTWIFYYYDHRSDPLYCRNCNLLHLTPPSISLCWELSCDFEVFFLCSGMMC